MSSINKLNNNAPTFEEAWPQIQDLVMKLLRVEFISRNEWQDNFYTIHSICMWDERGAQKLLDHLKVDIVNFIQTSQFEVMSNQEDQALLKSYIAAWKRFFKQCKYLPLPFVQLETLNKSKKPPSSSVTGEVSMVRKLMLDSWNRVIFEDIKHRLQSSAMKLVLAERNGESFDSQLVIGVRESYVNLCSNANDPLQIYRDNFENAYFEATENYYRSKASQYLEANGVQEYMKWADCKLREEENRATKYLEQYVGSSQALSERCVVAMLSGFKDIILVECPEMIKNNETEKLKLMFRLMDRVPEGINPMLTYLEQFILQEGLADMMASAETITQDSEKYVEQLLVLFRRFSKLVSEAFNDDPRFLTSRDKAFKMVVNDASIFKIEMPSRSKGSSFMPKNQPESKCPELLSNYCDMLLRKTALSKKLTIEQIEKRLKEVVLVLKYIENRDVFMRYHKNHLARRLILDTSADNEKEENMVNWLREVGMPADYVHKLGRMFLDIKVSEDMNQRFKDSLGSSPLGSCVNIKILNTGAWMKVAERIPVSLPTELEEIIPEIEEFYKKNHNGRVLRWHHHVSTGTINLATDVGSFELEVTTLQIALLFVWNERPKDKISFEDLKIATEIPDTELRRTVWSLLSCPKIKRQVLLSDNEVKVPKDLTDSTLIWVNNNFGIVKNGKVQRRGRINLIGRLQLATEANKEEENKGIVELRAMRTQEAIIKIMKMRRQITFAQLQTELVEILKNIFLPSTKLIKEQIEWLIENKYMKRDDDDISVYYYLA